MNPFTANKYNGDLERHGFHRTYGADPLVPGTAITTRLARADGSVMSVTDYWYPPEVYEAAFTAAGFTKFAWVDPCLAAPEDGGNGDAVWEEVASRYTSEGIGFTACL